MKRVERKDDIFLFELQMFRIKSLSDELFLVFPSNSIIRAAGINTETFLARTVWKTNSTDQ